MENTHDQIKTVVHFKCLRQSTNIYIKRRMTHVTEIQNNQGYAVNKIDIERVRYHLSRVCVTIAWSL